MRLICATIGRAPRSASAAASRACCLDLRSLPGHPGRGRRAVLHPRRRRAVAAIPGMRYLCDVSAGAPADSFTRSACPAGTSRCAPACGRCPRHPLLPPARNLEPEESPFGASCWQPPHGAPKPFLGTHQIGQLPFPKTVGTSTLTTVVPDPGSNRIASISRGTWCRRVRDFLLPLSSTPAHSLSGRPPRDNSSPHSSASPNGRILRCWVLSQP